MSYILAIDQGTTSSRAIIFDRDCNVVASDQQEFPQYFPKPGWVEHDPEEIWNGVLATIQGALKSAELEASAIAAIGITNQRETTIAWNKKTGRAIYPAIVWQDRRTAESCELLKQAGHERLVNQTTGLLLDPYFSATKIAWILNHVDGARKMAEYGEIAVGNIDSYLLWRFTDGQSFFTDATNASRTMLMDIVAGSWSPEMLDLFEVPESVLPEIRNCADDFGTASMAHLGSDVPITGIAGDQQAAAIGQACFSPGMIKSTYGTGCFALLNIGSEPVFSQNQLLTTIACQLNGERTYAIEGSIFSAGSTVQWLRDQLKFIERADQAEILAAQSNPDLQVYLVPAFVGLGAPYWDADCRGTVIGLTRDAGINEIARAALESTCFQTADLVRAMVQDWQTDSQPVLRVDGGMSASNWTMQRLSDILNATIDRPAIIETTALGAAYLAGHQINLYGSPDEFAQSWKLDQRFTPQMDDKIRTNLLAGWHNAVNRTLTKDASKT